MSFPAPPDRFKPNTTKRENDRPDENHPGDYAERIDWIMILPSIPAAMAPKFHVA
jgi:hypothetical protein